MHYLRKELYQLIKSDESIFDFIQESSLDGLWYWDLENPEELWMNVKFWRTLGYDSAGMAHKTKAWEQLIFQEDLQAAKKDFQNLLTNPSFPYHREMRYRHKDGSTIWISCRAFAIRDGKGKSIRVVGAHINLTELKRKEQLLVETNRVARVGAWELDLVHNKLYWSEVTKEIHEVSPDYIPDLEEGINFYKEGESRQIITECVEKAISEGVGYDVELQIVTHKNKTIWVRAIGQPEVYEGACRRIYGVFQDIEKQKQAEIKLTESEEQFRQTFEHAVSGIAVVGLSGALLRVNNSFCQIFGYSRKELLTMNFQDLSSKEGLKESLKKLGELKRGEREVYYNERKYIHKKGHYVWVSISVSRVVDALGKIIHFVAQYSDITQRFLATQKLKQREKEVQQIFDNAVVGMALVNDKGKWIRVNDSLCNFLGYSKKELLNMSFAEVTHPDYLKETYHHLEKLVTGEVTVFHQEVCFIHKNGRLVYAIVGVSRITNENGELLHYVAQYADISAQKRAVGKLRQERTFLQTLIDNLPVNVYIKDLASRKTLVNQMELKHLGVATAEEILGKEESQLYPPESAKISREEDLFVFNTGQPILNRETLNIKIDGTQTWFLTSKIPLVNQEGEIDSLLGISYDVTKFKEAEEKMRKYSILETKSKEMEQFSYIVSHDLREPLATMKGYLNLLVEEFLNQMPADAQEILQLSAEGAHRMDELIHGLLDYSRLSQVKALVELDCNQLLEQVLADLSATIVKNKVIFEIAPLPTLLGFVVEMKQLFQNLINNAIKFRKRTISPIIEISSQKIKAGWQFKIKDNGIGIQESEKERIFQIFQRLNKDYEGTGIGLANCKKIVEKHGGDIWVESVLGEGSTFYFTILTKGLGKTVHG